MTSNPDFSRIDRVLRRSALPDRVPLYELFSDIEEDVLASLGERSSVDAYGNAGDSEGVRKLKRHIRYQLLLHYDYATIREGMTGFVFPLSERGQAETNEGLRGYMREGDRTIRDWQTFESYPWPEIRHVDFSPFEAATSLLPDGVKIVADSPGVFETVLWLLGYDGLSYLLFDDPDLVKATFEAVGARILRYFESIVSFGCVGAIRYGDDMGFKTQLLVAPEVLRKYVFPWHREVVDMVHKAGKPIILHACGNLGEVFEEILNTGWDAKHSFEDAIEPIWVAKRRYGDRISLLGGFDMVKLAVMTEQEVRAHTRFLIEQCAPGGGWALGSGNSITDYIPVGNLLAMIDECMLAGKY